jgi:Transposase, Mutator family
MTAPVLAVGDGALGFWGALGEVFPETLHQRCWVHKMANVMNALPKSAQPAARGALCEVRDAEDRAHAEKALDAFVADYGAKWPKARRRRSKRIARRSSDAAGRWWSMLPWTAGLPFGHLIPAMSPARRRSRAQCSCSISRLMV